LRGVERSTGGVLMAWPVRNYRLVEDFPLPRTKVWDLLADTDHLNRVIGLFTIEASPPKTEGGQLYRVLSATALGFVKVRWREYPFDWVQYERYTTIRTYELGPFSRFVGGVELTDTPTGTRVVMTASFTPRNPIGLIAARTEGLKSMHKTLTYIRQTAAALESDPHSVIKLAASHTTSNSSAMATAFAELATLPVGRAESALLQRLLTEATDDEVVGMRPFQVARAWGANPIEVLRLFLYATKAGALVLNWHMLCPNCRVGDDGYDTLGRVTPQAHCDFCGVTFEVNFDRYVELRFDVHPAIRRATRSVYCVSGPAFTPHIVRQQYIRQGERHEISYRDDGDDLRLRVLRSPYMLAIDRDLLAESVPALHYSEDGWNAASISANQPVVIENHSGADLVLVVEKTEWDSDAVTAARVTAMQEFRSLFSSEVLAPGQEVGIENVTLFFSDLLASTAMYETIGDASAYGKVRRHFDFLIGRVNEQTGSLVKTIGDAVMAVFYSPEDGVRAALEIQRQLQQFNHSLPSGSAPIVLKIGLHHGPAIAINANDRLDYFGRTVNIAARMQRESQGGDLVISDDTYRRPGVQELLTEYGVRQCSYNANLKGINGEIGVVRLQF